MLEELNTLCQHTIDASSIQFGYDVFLLWPQFHLPDPSFSMGYTNGKSLHQFCDIQINGYFASAIYLINLMSFHQWILDSKIIDTEFQCDHRIRLAFFSYILITFGILRAFYYYYWIKGFRGNGNSSEAWPRTQFHLFCFSLIQDIDDFILNIACILPLFFLHVCQSTSSVMYG